jgi:hypothetical protein
MIKPILDAIQALLVVIQLIAYGFFFVLLINVYIQSEKQATEHQEWSRKRSIP